MQWRVALCGLLAFGIGSRQERQARWEKVIAAIENRDLMKAPPKGAIHFAGSSSIVRWDLEKSFPGKVVVNRGFGGSYLADSTHFAPRILLPHDPKIIIVYAGDNDLAGGKSPEHVADDFAEFVKLVRRKSPQRVVAFISIKPSLARWKLADRAKKANALIEQQCRKGSGLLYLDVWTPMLGADGMPRADLFVKDGLHLSQAGYDLWTRIVRERIPELADLPKK